MAYGIGRILPTLVDQAAPGLRRILDEAVTVEIAVPLCPGQRRLDVGPELGDGVEVTRPSPIKSGKNDE
jgi:hypothetical protein